MPMEQKFPGNTTVDAATGSMPSIYIYPITPYTFLKGSNDYILRVKEVLASDFKVVNKATKLGILDILLKLPKTNIIYFNWIADIADRRFGYLQIPVLVLILAIAKITRIKIAWFIHNDVSHFRSNWRAKRLIRRIMLLFSDVVLSHSRDFSIAPKIPHLKVFEHPVETRNTVDANTVPEYDALVWGSVSPYKGVLELAKYNHTSDKLENLRILVAGRFNSEKFYNEVSRYKKGNIDFVNRVQEEQELEELFCRSRFVLFCYSSSSVLSSAALCKTLSFGKTIIGPHIGAFRELGKRNLIYTYRSFDDLANLMQSLKTANSQIDQQQIRDYISRTTWDDFGKFLVQHLGNGETGNEGISPAPAAG